MNADLPAGKGIDDDGIAALAMRHGRALQELALDSIRHGLSHGEPPHVVLDHCPPELRQAVASFVTLKLAGKLRGCIGMLEPVRAVAVDVTDNAYGAAFRDPRFSPLAENELPGLTVGIALLGTTRKMEFTCERDLIGQLRPGVDGLIIEDRGRRGTFLPAVWEMLPDPGEFLLQLKLKAGLPADHWSDTLTVSCYRCHSVE